jgi:hypothetical protein
VAAIRHWKKGQRCPPAVPTALNNGELRERAARATLALIHAIFYNNAFLNTKYSFEFFQNNLKLIFGDAAAKLDWN